MQLAENVFPKEGGRSRAGQGPGVIVLFVRVIWSGWLGFHLLTELNCKSIGLNTFKVLTITGSGLNIYVLCLDTTKINKILFQFQLSILATAPDTMFGLKIFINIRLFGLRFKDNCETGRPPFWEWVNQLVFVNLN